MKFFKSRTVATIVLVLAVLGASFYGLSKKPAELPDVEYYHWISDRENLLTASTEDVIESYNTAWNDRYYAVIAVAAVDNIRGWTAEDFVYDLGEKWGLGANDMLLLLVEDGDYYVGLGDNLLVMTDTQQSQLQLAIDTDYYKGDFDAAVVSFFRQADVFYAQMAMTSAYNGPNYEWVGSGGSNRMGMSIFGILLVVVVVFLIWAALDKMRYNRYQRRVRVTPGIVYYPVFWGRPRRPVVPVTSVPPVQSVRPTRPAPGPSVSYQPPRTNRTTTVQRNTTSRPANRNSSRSSFGNGGFGGGSRGGRSGNSRSGGFGGGKRR